MVGVSTLGLVAGVGNVGAGLGALIGAVMARTYLDVLQSSEINDE